MGWLTGLENRKADGTLISSYEYDLGDAGNRLSVTEHTGRVVNYDYDDLYRLVEEEILDPTSSNETISYTYDDFGNRLSKTDATGTTEYHYDDNDRLYQEDRPDGTTIAYAYDDNGNTLTKSDGTDTATYSWDAENRLISLDDGVSVTEYEYDADGIRISTETDGDVTDYLVDKNRDYAQVLEERDGSGGLIVAYVYGDNLISQKRGDSEFFYHYDGQLSVRQLSDADGDISDDYIYDAFGMLIEQSGDTVNDYLYTGEQYDPNAGFYYLRARYYDPKSGRFVSSDPYAGRQSEPVTLHKYLYANANPIIYTDKSGLFSIIELSAANSVRNIIIDTELNTASSFVDAINGDQDAAYTNAVVSSVPIIGSLGRNLKKVKHFFKGKKAKGFDWEHIIERHSDFGRIARQRTTGTIFEGLTERQIKARVKAAWKNRKPLRTQVGPDGVTRIRYVGIDPVSGQMIEMWQNQVSGIVETAYPLI